MKRLFLALMLLISVNIIHAQTDDFGESWPIIEQCISLETTPPADWSFNGTILMTNRGHLRGYRQEWDTTHVLAFHSDTLAESLSPDGLWYAVVEGTNVLTNLDAMIGSFTSTAIRVFSTADGTAYTIPWENTYIEQRRVIGHGLYWADNTHLLHSMGDSLGETWFLINPFTGEVSPWIQTFDPTAFVFALSPDGQKGVSADWRESFWTIHTTNKTVQVPIRTTRGALWHPSSSYFITLTRSSEEAEPVSLLMFNLNGEIEQHIYRTRSETGHLSDPRSMAWSRDGRYLAFNDETLLIADLENHQIWNTCVPESAISWSFAWSSDGEQLAVNDIRGRDAAIRIIDIPSLASYIAGYHRAGIIIGWRADDQE